jgi:hypothetical protein
MADAFLALIWLCFSEYQKLFHVLFLAYVVRFEVESTFWTYVNGARSEKYFAL